MAAPQADGARGSGAGPLEAALVVQRAFMDRYGDLLEQLLSVCVYLVPVQDEEDRTGYWSQAVYSVLDLFNLYRTVLLRKPEALPVAAAAAEGAAPPRTRRLRLQYTGAAFLLRALRSVQVLLEMRAVRAAGLQAALRACLGVEAAKLALKLAMRSRTPFAFYVDEDALEAVEPPRPQGERAGLHSGGPLALEGGAAAPSEAFVGRRSGKTLRGLGGPGGEGAASLPPAAAGLVGNTTVATPQILAAEALFHGRPLLHAWMLLRRGRRSWAAWLLALLLDVLSLSLLAPELRHTPNTRAAALESAEVQRRRAQLWWALARSPFYDRFLLRPCEALDSLLKRIPVVNIFNFVELAIALQPFHFSTSAS